MYTILNTKKYANLIIYHNPSNRDKDSGLMDIQKIPELPDMKYLVVISGRAAGFTHGILSELNTHMLSGKLNSAKFLSAVDTQHHSFFKKELRVKFKPSERTIKYDNDGHILLGFLSQNYLIEDFLTKPSQISIIEHAEHVTKVTPFTTFDKYLDMLIHSTYLSSIFNNLIIIHANQSFPQLDELMKNPRCYTVYNNTLFNAINLPKTFLESIIDSYPNLLTQGVIG